MNGKQKIWLAAVAVVLLVLVAGISLRERFFSSPPVVSEQVQQEAYLVAEKTVSDEKAVFATVESANVIPARARIGGTIVDLKVRQGDKVEKGQAIAVVGDQKLGLQIQSQQAQVRAAQAQVDQAKDDLDRAEKLIKEGFATKERVDQLRTAYNVALNALKAQSAQQSVTQQQQSEGQILAPASGRVLTVPVIEGAVIMPGEVAATIAEQNYILRLSVPERHAAFIKAGDTVRVDAGGLGVVGEVLGNIELIYPKIEAGRLQADAKVSGVGDYFVGQRVRVWVSAGERKAIIIPAEYIKTRDGLDFVRVKYAGGSIDIPVQRGQSISVEGLTDGVEILSGIKAGDELVQP